MALDCYINISDIPGEAKVTGYEDWIKADSFTIGVSSSGGHTTELHDLSFVHPIDKASAKLVDACCNDTDLSEVEVDLVEESTMYMKYVFSPGSKGAGADAHVLRVTSVSPSGASGEGDRPREHVSIRYGKLKVTYSDGNIEGEYDASLS